MTSSYVSRCARDLPEVLPGDTQPFELQARRDGYMGISTPSVLGLRSVIVKTNTHSGTIHAIDEIVADCVAAYCSADCPCRREDPDDLDFTRCRLSDLRKIIRAI